MTVTSLMQGFPPAPSHTVRFEDLLSLGHPGWRWVQTHWRELAPTACVRRGTGAARPLPASAQPLDGLTFDDPAGGRCSLDEGLVRTDTDGLLILHDGQVIFERYLAHLRPELPHRCWSVTKSFVGLLATMLVHEGRLDPASRVVAHLPELAGSGWSEATVRQVMDMTLAMAFDENYDHPASDVVPGRIAAGALPAPPGYAGARSIADFLPTVRASGPHGVAFQYVTPNTEVLAWIVQRLTGTPLATLLSERLWQRLGADEDAYFQLDRNGMAGAGGGLCVTLRDLARVGELLRQRGRVDGEQVIPEAVIDDIARGGDCDKFSRAGWDLFAGWSYRSQWWVSHDEFGSFRALGVHGQQLYVAPGAGLVIARFGSQRTAVDEAVERLFMSAFRTLARRLTR